MRNWTRWLVALLAAIALGAAMMRAQGSTDYQPKDYQMVSGADVGFRVEGHDADGKPYGTWMIRVDGRWVEAGSKPKVHRATQH